MAEVEDEVEYFRAQKEPPKPRYVIPFDDVGGEKFFSDYLNKRTLDPEEVRANKIKLDSIILKGSLLLSHQEKSDYVDDAVFYIAKAYFYEREWFQSQEKAIELIENFPESKWQPEAHLIYAMDLLKQGELAEAEDMLSKTVDVAFKFKRADILTEAFRLNADVQLAQGEPEQAIKPYERAILLSDDDEEQAQWQKEIGVVYFRAGRFGEAIAAFDKVEEYDPDDVTKFEAGLQRAVALRAAGRFDEAEEQLELLTEEEDYEDWIGLVEVERLSLEADRKNLSTLDSHSVKALDSLDAGEYILYGIYERGVRAFNDRNYEYASVNFAKVASAKSPYSKKARTYSIWINFFRDEKRIGDEATRIHLLPFPDSLGLVAARAYYNVARFFLKYNIDDSTERYYRESLRWAPKGSEEGARALYALSEHFRRSGYGIEADSLLTVLAETYGDNDYADQARHRLGYSEDWVVDLAKRDYENGLNLMQNAGEYRIALSVFSRVYNQYAGSQYAAMSLYASGLIFEKFLNNLDSALYYYSLLIERYPESEQAKAMRPAVEVAVAERGSDVTAIEDGLIPLDETEGDPEITPTTDTTSSEPEIKWYDDALYEPRPELAMKRRGKRTIDEEYKP